MADPELPAAVEEARRLVERQSARAGRMVVGILVFCLMIIGAASTHIDPLVYAALFGLFAWIGVHVGPSLTRRDDLRGARALLTQWHLRDAAELLASERPASDPEDPRWPAVVQLLDRVQQLGGHEAAALVRQAREHVRELLADVGAVEAALEAEQALGGERQHRVARLRRALASKNDRLDALIEGIRDLHVELAVREDGGGDPVAEQLERLLRQVEAEVEVEEVGSTAEDEAARRQAAARAAARQRTRGD